MKKLLKIGLVIIVFFVLLFVGLAITLNILFPKERIIAELTPVISKTLNRDVKIGDAGISVFPYIGFHIDDVKIDSRKITYTALKQSSLESYLKESGIDSKEKEIMLNGKSVSIKKTTINKGDKISISPKGFIYNEPLFAIDTFAVSVEVMPLISKKVVVDEITIKKLSVLVEKSRSGKFNFDDIVASLTANSSSDEKKDEKKADSKFAGLPVTISLNALNIKDSKISYIDRQKGQKVVLGSINSNIAVSVDQSLDNIVTSGVTGIKSISLSDGSSGIAKSGMNFSLKHNLSMKLSAKSFSIKNISLGFQQLVLNVKGNVRLDKSGKIILDTDLSTGEINLSSLKDEVPAAVFKDISKIDTAGKMSFAAKVKGEIDPSDTSKLPSVNGTFNLKNGKFSYTGMPESVKDMNIDIAFTENSLNIKDLSLKAGNNPFMVKGTVINFEEPELDILSKGTLNLPTVAKIVAFPEGTKLDGSINLDLTAKGKADVNNPASVNVDGNVSLNSVNYSISGKPAVKANGAVVFKNEEISSKGITVQVGKSSVTGSFDVRNFLPLVFKEMKASYKPTVSLGVNSPFVDVDELLGFITGTSVEQTETTATTGDEEIIIPTLPDIKVIGNINFAKINLKKTNFGSVNGDIYFDEGKFNANVNMNIFSSTLKETFKLDISNPEIIKLSTLTNFSNIDFNEFISTLNNFLPDNKAAFKMVKKMDNTVYGKASVKADFNTKGITVNQFTSNLSGELVVKSANGKVAGGTLIKSITDSWPDLLKKFVKFDNNLNFSSAALYVTVEQGKIIIKDSGFSAKDYDLNMNGTMAFDSILDIDAGIKLSKTVSSEITSKQKAVQSELNKLGGKLGKYGKKVAGVVVSETSVPADKDGRVTPVFHITGKADSPKAAFAGFSSEGAVSNGTEGGAENNIKTAVEDAVNEAARNAKEKAEQMKKEAEELAAKKKQELKEEAARKKAEAEAKLNEEKRKAQAAAEQKKKEAEAKVAAEKAKAKAKAEEEKAKAKAKAEEEKRKAKEKAKEKAKKLGF